MRLIQIYRPSEGGRLSWPRHCSKCATRAQSCVLQRISVKNTDTCPQRGFEPGTSRATGKRATHSTTATGWRRRRKLRISRSLTVHGVVEELRVPVGPRLEILIGQPHDEGALNRVDALPVAVRVADSKLGEEGRSADTIHFCTDGRHHLHAPFIHGHTILTNKIHTRTITQKKITSRSSCQKNMDLKLVLKKSSRTRTRTKIPGSYFPTQLTSVFGQTTFPDLCPIDGWQVTTCQ